jgi:hypothetical protein
MGRMGGSLMELKAVSLWPEWLYAIVHLNKRVENRTWPAHRKTIGERIALHAGKNFGGRNKCPARMHFEPVIELGIAAGYRFKDLYASKGFLKEWIGFRVYDSEGNELFPMDTRLIPRGAIVATALLKSSSFLYAGNSEYEDGTQATAWSAEGNYGWQLEDIKVFDEPVLMNGCQGIWRVKSEYLVEVERQLN